MSGRTPNYRLKYDHVYRVGTSWSSQSITLPKGTWVRPIETPYVPKHILEDERWKDSNLTINVFCYTPKGFCLIDRKDIEEA